MIYSKICKSVTSTGAANKGKDKTQFSFTSAFKLLNKRLVHSTHSLNSGNISNMAITPQFQRNKKENK
jgi:hypothetical protein